MPLPAGIVVTKQMLDKIQGMKASMVIMDDFNCLADCAQAPAAPSKQGWPCKSKKDENPMNYATASATLVATDTTDKDQRRYLKDQLYYAYDKAKTALQRKFGLIDDEAPVTLADTIKRIQDGLFVIPEKYKDKGTYGSLSYLRWRDPKAIEDKVGYEAAKAPLKTAYTTVERQIVIFTPEKSLEALIAFEAAQAK